MGSDCRNSQGKYLGERRRGRRRVGCVGLEDGGVRYGARLVLGDAIESRALL